MIGDDACFGSGGVCATHDRDRSGGHFWVEGFHEIQNYVNDRLIAERGIDHAVVNGAVRPFDAEILLDKIGAFPINRIHQLLGFRLQSCRERATAALYLPSEHKETNATCLGDF